MIDLVVIPRIHRPERRRLSVPAPASPGDLVGRILEPGDWHFIADGRRVRRDEPMPAKATELLAIRAPEGVVGAIIVSSIVSALVGIGVAFLVNLLFGETPDGQSNEQSPTYGFSGIRNTTTQGTPIAKIYGRHRVAGQILNVYRRTGINDADEVLYMVVGLGSGPVQAINQESSHADAVGTDAPSAGIMRINGLPASSYEGVTAWYRMGTTTQPALPAPLSAVVQQYDLDVTVEANAADGDWQEFSTQDRVAGLYINLRFPRGLYRTDPEDGLKEWPIALEFQYLVGETWVPIPPYDDGNGNEVVGPGGVFQLTELRTRPFTRSIWIGAEGQGAPWSPSPRAVRIRYRRLDPPATDQLIQDEVRIADVGEILSKQARDYGGTALVGLEIRADEQLQGRIPNVTHLVDGSYVPVVQTAKDPDLEAPTVAYQFSRNPAWVALDILLDRVNGLGNDVTLADIDADSWVRWAQWCDEVVEYAEAELEPLDVNTDTEAVEKGAASVVVTSGSYAEGQWVQVESEAINRVAGTEDLGGGRTRVDLMRPIDRSYPDNFAFKTVELAYVINEQRARCDIVFDREQSAWDALKAVMRTGRGVPCKFGDRVKVRWEGEAGPTQHVSDTGMIEGSLEIDYIGKSERVDEVEVQFLDEGVNYDQAVERAGTTLDVLDKDPVRRTVQAYGITRRSHARREAHYQLLMSRLVWRRCRFRLPVDGVTFEPGDVFSLGSTLPDWSLLSSRASGTVAELRLDHPLTIAPDTEYRALIRTPGELVSETVEPLEVTITSTPGTYAPGDVITTDGSALALDRAAITIGTLGRTATLWRCTGMSVTRDLEVQVEAVQYEPRIYGLPGWPFGVPDPPPSGECLVDGDYFLDITDLFVGCTCEFDCGPDRTCVPAGSNVNVFVEGAGADGVEILGIEPSGVFIRILPGFGGTTVTITVEGGLNYACCPDTCLDPDECLCIGPVSNCQAEKVFQFELC